MTWLQRLRDWIAPALAAGRGPRTPTMMQIEAVECGAAALGMILGYYGRWVALDELRVTCGVSRDGSRASNVFKAAVHYGLEGQAFKVEPDDLATLDMPAIIFWEMNHFVVVEGRSGRRWRLNDPARGRRWVSEQEFDEAFTGVTLCFRPGPDFRREGSRPSVMTGLMRRIEGEKRAFALLLLASLVLVVPGLLVPTFSKIFIDYYLVGQFNDWLIPLLLGMSATALLSGAATWLQLDLLARFEGKLALEGASGFLRWTMRLPMTFFAQRSSGEVVGRITLNDRLARLVTGEVARSVLNVVTALVFLVVMAQYDLGLAALALFFALVTLVALGWMLRDLADQNQILLNETNRLRGQAMQGLQMIDTIKAAGAENTLFARLAGLRARMLAHRQNVAGRIALVSGLPVFLSTAAAAAVLVVGGNSIMAGEMTVGTLVGFQGLMAAFTAPLVQLVLQSAQLQDARVHMRLIDDSLGQPMDEEFTESTLAGPAAGKLRGHVEFRDVTFGYSRLEEPLVRDFRLSIDPGRRIALVGGSGSGKSTVARLVSGLYRPWSGELLLDGTPSRLVPRDVLRRSVAVVEQAIFLFEGTVRDNLTLWDDTIPEERMVAAAKAACIHDFIAGRPGGYSSRVAEGGFNLSGGQAARLEIARALIQEPSLLILDEATAALDAETEARLVENLRRVGCTTLVIAHRLSTVRDCDEIIVVDGGRILERGSHDRLKAAGGAYAALLEA